MNNYGHTEIAAGDENGKVTLIGSNNRNADGSQRITCDTHSASHSNCVILTSPH